jgi:hypothetical protein
VSLQHHLSLEQNARLFALLNIGLADAAINCWGCKYVYNFWRPVTAIRDPRASQLNPATASDPNWTPLWNTPNFPGYDSGHSTFSGAASVILASLFGPNTGFTSGSDDMPGYSRSFTSFGQAADEAGDSRVVGGIHFAFDNTAGLTAGRELGGYIAENFLRPLRGGRHPHTRAAINAAMAAAATPLRLSLLTPALAGAHAPGSPGPSPGTGSVATGRPSQAPRGSAGAAAQGVPSQPLDSSFATLGGDSLPDGLGDELSSTWTT